MTTSPKPTLSEDQLHALLLERPDWTVRDGKLVRGWTFKDFAKAIAFVNQVAQLAEQANHHPDIDVRYNQVELALVSHDAGGITERDGRMARELSANFPATPA